MKTLTKKQRALRNNLTAWILGHRHLRYFIEKCLKLFNIFRC